MSSVVRSGVWISAFLLVGCYEGTIVEPLDQLGEVEAEPDEVPQSRRLAVPAWEPAVPGTNADPDVPGSGSWIEWHDDPVLREGVVLLDEENLVADFEILDENRLRIFGTAPALDGVSFATNGFAPGSVVLQRETRMARVVVHVAAESDGVLELETAPAALEDVFEEMDATIHLNPVRVDGGYLVAADSELDCNDRAPCILAGTVSKNAGAYDAVPRDGAFSCDESFKENITLEPFFEHDWDGRIRIKISLKKKKARLYYEVNAAAKAGVRLTSEGQLGLEASVNCEADFVELLFGETPHWTLARASVLGIPVELYAEPILAGQFGVEAEGLNFKLEAFVEGELYQKQGWDPGDSDDNRVAEDDPRHWDRNSKEGWVDKRHRGIDFGHTLEVEQYGEVRATASVETGAKIGVKAGAEAVLVAATLDLWANVWADFNAVFSASIDDCTYGVEFPWYIRAQAGIEVLLKLLFFKFEHDWSFPTNGDGSWTLASGTFGEIEKPLGGWCQTGDAPEEPSCSDPCAGDVCGTAFDSCGEQQWCGSCEGRLCADDSECGGSPYICAPTDGVCCEAWEVGFDGRCSG